ncbi:TonB-dependent receptor family protein [Variovorax arabinosiphilus]|uniref:TonB-dependent receptor family protein n=1 Tax=Variovorax arabinosiphilus TaxID=3053498 RepID=UPI002577AEF8|nr:MULTISPECIES: TonB-dependent siderophore receptor [unclassified Variovorax]MDM0121792.1 TonB-dependent siderophore receptor [Variovorax sp. J2L1-78]MDM0130853.1 TonB-dependent siderophore receptor [Variovorax sp. J2L1-63]MDM0234555.1 TonB-dependent siderophore receptor [Variovorax sp. J2R1-6]
MALFPISFQAVAAEGDATGSLDAVTVTGDWLGTPTETKVLEHAGARTIIERPQIQESGSSSVRDVLRQVPGVQVQESNGTGGSDISLNVGVRGLTSRLSPRSTILLDGVPLAYAPYGQPQLSLAPLSLGNLEAVDVVRGAGSVRYGPQNVGGIINFVSRAIPKPFTAEASMGVESASHGGGTKTTPSVFIGGTNDNGLGLALLYSGTHGDGWRQSNDHVSIDDLMLKGTYRISKTDDIAVALHHFEGSGRMPGGLTTAQFAANPFQSDRPFDEFTGRRTDGSIRYTHNDGVNKFELLTYYTDSFRGSHLEQEGTGATAGQRRLTAAPRDYTTFAVEPRYSRLFDSGSVVQEVSVGYRYLKEEASETATRSAYYRPRAGFDAYRLANPAYQTSEGGTTAHAFYIDDRIDFGNWTITPGVRHESISSFNNVYTVANNRITGAIFPAIDSDEWLPTLSAMYRLNARWSLFANAGVSFGPQQYAQLAQSTTNLHPEKAKTYELGTHYKGEAWSGELTLFNIDFDKELQLARSITGEVGQWTDLGATRHRGLESGLRYDLGTLSASLKGLSVSGTYTYTQAISKAGVFAGRDLPFYSRQVATLGARYERGPWVFNADVYAQSKQRSPGSPDAGAVYVTQEDATGRLGDIPGYATMNLRAGYDFGRNLSNLKVAVGVKNAFDRRYFNRSVDNNGGKYVGQPRTLYVQASVGF